jgi:hypothetical protein
MRCSLLRLHSVILGAGSIATSLCVHADASASVRPQVGNDIRQSLNAMQMWRAKSSTVSYSDMKQGTP